MKSKAFFIIFKGFSMKQITEIFLEGEGPTLTYSRYIHDIFLIWTGTKNKLDHFFKDLNKKHPPIKFDCKASKNRIVFLATETYLRKDKLHTKIYRKENEQQHYLHIKSEHPKS